MGFLSKVWKGVKKGFKKIGKGIKSAFKSIGKFMGKIGIAGQIAMMFMPFGIGQILSSTFSSVVAGIGKLGSVGANAAKVIQAAGNFVKVGHNAFKTVTEGVTSFVSEFGKTALNKVGFKIEGAATSFGDAWSNVKGDITAQMDKTISSFNTAIGKPDLNLKATTTPAKPLGTEAVDTTVKPAVTSNATDTTSTSILERPEPQPTGAGGVATGEESEAFFPQLKQDIKEFPARVKEYALSFDDKIIEQANKLPEKVGTALAEAPAEGIKTAAIQAIAGKPEGVDIYSTQVQGMSTAFDMPPVGASPETNIRASSQMIDPTAFAMQNVWGASAQPVQNASYEQVMGFDRFGMRG